MYDDNPKRLIFTCTWEELGSGKYTYITQVVLFYRLLLDVVLVKVWIRPRAALNNCIASEHRSLIFCMTRGNENMRELKVLLVVFDRVIACYCVDMSNLMNERYVRWWKVNGLLALYWIKHLYSFRKRGMLKQHYYCLANHVCLLDIWLSTNHCMFTLWLRKLGMDSKQVTGWMKVNYDTIPILRSCTYHHITPHIHIPPYIYMTQHLYFHNNNACYP